MGAIGYVPKRRFELGWLLAGFVWGVVLGVAAATVPTAVLILSSLDELPSQGDLVVALLWTVLFAATGAADGGMAGIVVGLVVMLAVGRDPELRAARRTPATVALLVIPLALLAFLWVV